MTWWQFSLNCQATELEQVEDLMSSLGALSVSLSDAGNEPIYEPLPGTSPVWRQSKLTATFDGKLDPASLHQQLVSLLPEHLSANLRRDSFDDQDWQQAYKNHCRPVQCAPNLWIVPSWLAAPDPKATVIRLDPGLAFGSGNHPTTGMCLSWLADNPLEGQNVIDFGCGSGILAIAAYKLGAQKIRAVDIDPQALTATESNLKVNDIDPARIQLSVPATMESSPATLLMANILAAPLIELASKFAALVVPGGIILLSGILESQLDGIQLAYQPYFRFESTRQCEEWVCLSGTRIQQTNNGH